MLEDRCVFLLKEVVLVGGKKVVCANEKKLSWKYLLHSYTCTSFKNLKTNIFTITQI